MEVQHTMAGFRERKCYSIQVLVPLQPACNAPCTAISAANECMCMHTRLGHTTPADRHRAVSSSKLRKGRYFALPNRGTTPVALIEAWPELTPVSVISGRLLQLPDLGAAANWKTRCCSQGRRNEAATPGPALPAAAGPAQTRIGPSRGALG